MMLACDNLAIRRGQAEVVRGISAELRPGTITAIVGPNGAGKSSLLMGLAGLLPAESGAVRLDGTPLTELASRERACRIGYLPQSTEIAWDVAVENLVALGRMPHRDRGSEPVEAAIRVMELEELRTRPASQLSGGETSRALLARVLAGEPQWILADEPLAALDLAHQITLIDHLKSCARSGMGVVIVLHDLAMAMNHADRVQVLEEGALAADGTAQEALTPETIARVWGADVEWIGMPGRQAIVASSRD